MERWKAVKKQNMIKFFHEYALIVAGLFAYFFISVYGGIVLLAIFVGVLFPRIKWLALTIVTALIGYSFMTEFGEKLASHPERLNGTLAILGTGAVVIWLLDKSSDNETRWYGQLGLILVGAVFATLGLYIWITASWNIWVGISLLSGVFTAIPGAQGLWTNFKQRAKK